MPEVTQAVVLAAGRGTRFAPYTDFVPKPLIEVAGIPLLARVFRALPDSIGRVVVVVGYRGEMIRGAFGEVFEGRRITYVEQPHQTGTASALMCAAPYLDREEPVLLFYGDDLIDAASLKRLCADGQPRLLVSRVTESLARTMGLAICDDQGRVERVREKVQEPEALPTDFVSCGGMVLPTRDIMQLLEDARIVPDKPLPIGQKERYLTDFIEPLVRRLADRDSSIGIMEAKYWLPVNTPAQRRVAERFFLGLD